MFTKNIEKCIHSMWLSPLLEKPSQNDDQFKTPASSVYAILSNSDSRSYHWGRHILSSPSLQTAKKTTYLP
jgi:hypothetical protein